MNLIDVKHLAPAPVHTAQWLNTMLTPVVQVCRFNTPPDVHLAPLRGENSSYRGCFHVDYFQNSIALSIACGLWKRRDIIRVYIHEAAHMLVYSECRRKGINTEVHGPIFLLVNLVLVVRAKDFLKASYRDAMDIIDLYDFRSRPFSIEGPEHEWRSLVLAFGLKHCNKLADEDIPAEAIAEKAFDLWLAELKSIEQAGLEGENKNIEIIKIRNEYEFSKRRVSFLEGELQANRLILKLALVMALLLMVICLAAGYGFGASL